MSKSAAKYIRSATSGRTTDLLLDTLYSDNVRKNWRNADVLARFLVDTVANAYECENSTTFADNGYDSMEDAISGYVEANLCDWDQAKFLASSFGQRTAQEIADRLAEAVFKNVAFEVKQKATMTADQKAALAEGVDQFRETQCQAFLAYWRETCDVTTTLLTANRVWCQMRDEANKMNEGIDLACRILTAMEGEKARGEAASGCLIRDGYDEVVYLTAIAFRITKFKRIMRVTACQMANSFGGVIGEHEELIERLEADDYHHQAADIEAAFDEILSLSGMNEHKAQRRAYVAMLSNRK